MLWSNDELENDFLKFKRRQIPWNFPKQLHPQLFYNSFYIIAEKVLKR